MVRPSIAPHLLAALSSSATAPSQDDTQNEPVVEDNKKAARSQRLGHRARYRQKQARERGQVMSQRLDNPTPTKQSIKKLRELVISAKRAEPAAFTGKVKFGRVAKAIRDHCGMSSSEFGSFLVRAFHVQSPADGLRLHCSDLVILPGSSQSTRSIEYCEAQSFENLKQITKRIGDEFQDLKVFSDDECSDKQSNDRVEQISSGYVEFLQDRQKFVAGDVLKVVGESKRGFALKGVAPNGAVFYFAKELEGSMWKWAVGPEDGEEHYSQRRLQRPELKRQRTSKENYLDTPVERGTSKADADEHHQAHLAYPWVEINNENGIYYWNEHTGESQWDRPFDPELSEVEYAENNEDKSLN